MISIVPIVDFLIGQFWSDATSNYQRACVKSGRLNKSDRRAL